MAPVLGEVVRGKGGKGSTKIRVAVVQFDIAHGEPRVNGERVARLVEEAVRGEPHPDVAALPETWTTGYSRRVFRQIAAYVESLDGPSTVLLRELACQLRVTIVGGTMPLADAEGITNASLVVGPKGELLGWYDKMHLCSAGSGEHQTFRPGRELPVTATPVGQVGVMTCCDVRFPQVCRALALQGAEVVFGPANFPKPKLEYWRTLLRARAIENQLFVMAVNRCGKHGEAEYCGHSLVVFPWGQILAEAGEGEEILRAELDTEEIAQVRRTIPVFSDRRPDLYPAGEVMTEPGGCSWAVAVRGKPQQHPEPSGQEARPPAWCRKSSLPCVAGWSPGWVRVSDGSKGRPGRAWSISWARSMPRGPDHIVRRGACRARRLCCHPLHLAKPGNVSCDPAARAVAPTGRVMRCNCCNS